MRSAHEWRVSFGLGLLCTSLMTACSAPESDEPVGPASQDAEQGPNSAKKHWISVAAPSQLVTSEGGQSVELGLVLRHKPKADVRIPIAVSDPTEARLSVSEAVLTPSDLGKEFRVIVTGVDDALEDSDQSYAVEFGPATSDDKRFSGYDLPDLKFVNLDDCDSAQPSDESFTKQIDPPVYDVCIDPNRNIYVSGASPAGAATTQKYDRLGNLIWQIEGGGKIACDEAGHVIIAQDGTAEAPALLVERSGDSTLVWQRSLGGLGVLGSYAIGLDGSGNIDLIGPRSLRFSPSGELLKQVTFDFIMTGDHDGPLSLASATSDPNGNPLFIGTLSGDLSVSGQTISTSWDRAVVLKLDWAGHLLWYYVVDPMEDPSGVAVSFARGVATDRAGNVLVAAAFRGELDFPDNSYFFPGTSEGPGVKDLLLKLSADGHFVWSSNLQSRFFRRVADIATDAAGNVLVAGAEFTNFFPFEDALLMKLSEGGNVLWSTGARLPDYRGGSHTAVDADTLGNVVSTFRVEVGDIAAGTLTSKTGLLKRGP